MLHIVAEATEVPGRCAISGSETGPFLDTQVTIPRHGRLYLSIPYLNSVSSETGFVPAAEHEKVLEERDELMGAVEGLSRRVERFDEDVQNVADAMISWLAVVKARNDVTADVTGEVGYVSQLAADIAGRVAVLEGPTS